MKKYLKTIFVAVRNLTVKEDGPKVMYFSAILMAIIVTCSLVIRYCAGLMPFSHIDWLMIPMIVFTIIWSEKFCQNLPDRKKGAVMDLLIHVIYFIAIGIFFSMLGFQTLREVKNPTSIMLYAPWLFIAMFGYAALAGPIAEFRYCYKVAFRVIMTSR